MKQLRILLAAVVLLLPATSTWSSAAETQRVRLPSAGIEIGKPVSWHDFSPSDQAANLARTEFRNEEFGKLVREHATIPVFGITKYPEPYADVNPSLRISVRSKGSFPDDPKRLLETMIPTLRNAFQDFQLVEGPELASLGANKAGHVKIEYTLRTNTGDEFATTSEIWIMIRGQFIYIIGAGCKSDQSDGSAGEIYDILATLKFI